jgi:hypothetical protein
MRSATDVEFECRVNVRGNVTERTRDHLASPTPRELVEIKIEFNEVYAGAGGSLSAGRE